MEDETVPTVVGEHRDIPLTSEPTFLQGPDGLFEARIRLNAVVREMIYFGYLPIVEMRGLKSELKDVTHAAKGFTTGPVNPEKISRDWQKIESIEQLAVRPVMKFTVKSASLRYEPNPG